ncbi:MAG: c-type cytochrome [Acidiphilium sp.]
MRGVLLAAAALALGAAAPAGNAGQGVKIVADGTDTGVLPCAACHGADLRGNAAIGAPSIAGLSAAATLAAFDAIAAGRAGNNYVMRDIARALTAPERAAVAAYLAGLRPAPHGLSAQMGEPGQ